MQGSFALGDYDRDSDVDFITAIEDELEPKQLGKLQAVHDQIYRLDSERAKHLEGSYFPRDILRDYARRGAELWYLDHGARTLVRSDHCNTALVRWIVREKGIALSGPPPRTLVDPILEAFLGAEIFKTLTSWGQQILDNPATYSNRFYQGFIVLSYCRMLHDLHRGYPGSKRQGAQWAKSVLETSWSTLRFVAHVMSESRRYLADTTAPNNSLEPAP